MKKNPTKPGYYIVGASVSGLVKSALIREKDLTGCTISRIIENILVSYFHLEDAKKELRMLQAKEAADKAEYMAKERYKFCVQKNDDSNNGTDVREKDKE